MIITKLDKELMEYTMSVSYRGNWKVISPTDDKPEFRIQFCVFNEKNEDGMLWFEIGSDADVDELKDYIAEHTTPEESFEEIVEELENKVDDEGQDS